ncbi:hypothetical protein [Phycicoccus flavus]|uniref:hypothetical protein n=1 Tax=Phycicoccus flavus TaxID=2502783 RepID=UPI000FEB9723|nr:hypothetical protein [Phycicoccus flavus]NHA70115.1 hypothetical protein [Phycicoccus flavus]
MNWADAASTGSAVIAGIALIATLSELRRARRDRSDERTAEIDSVAVITRVVHRPVDAETNGRFSRWKYEFVVDNPGRLPISNVEVTIAFEVDVQRVHYDGSHEDPTRALEMIVPVIGAHARHNWIRTVLIPHTDRHQLRETVATVTFETLDRGAHTNRWPRGSGFTR